MSMYDFNREILELQEVCRTFGLEICPKGSQIKSKLLSDLLSRIATAINEGLPVLEAECRRRNLNASMSDRRWMDDTLVHVLERDLEREENPVIRWILISYWVALCDFSSIQSNIEALVSIDLHDWIWLVACALWVQSASGQPTADMLRDALTQLRMRYAALDAYIEPSLAKAPTTHGEAIDIAQRLLLDPTATLPTFKVF